MEASSLGDVLIETADPYDGAGRDALWAYVADVASRWYGRPATDEEATALLDDPSEDLAAPGGALLVVRRGEAVLGCAGLRVLADGVGVVKRVFVAPGARGRGLGRRLVLELEEVARARGLHTLRLDTRSDLVEARALYAALGYVEVPALNDGPYAEHWYAKALCATTGQSEAQARGRGPACGRSAKAVQEPLRMRAARAEDYDRIAAVVDGWWGRSVSASLPRLFLDHFWSTSRVVDDERGLGAFLIALVSPGEPLVAYVHFVGVRPDHRRGGLARRLYDDFARQAQAQGCTELRAITAPGNAASIDFHRSLGFSVSEPEADYNGPGRPMVTFRRRLSPSDAPGQP